MSIGARLSSHPPPDRRWRLTSRFQCPAADLRCFGWPFKLTGRRQRVATIDAARLTAAQLVAALFALTPSSLGRPSSLFCSAISTIALVGLNLLVPSG